MQHSETKEKWVLVVEDNIDHAELAERTLGKACQELLTVFCESTERAMNILWNNREFPPAAVFIDIDLGGESGLDLVKRIKASEVLRDVKAIVLTCAWDDDTRTAALLAGADAFVAKPLALKRAVRFLMSNEIAWDLSDLPQDLDEYRRQRKANQTKLVNAI